MRSPCNGLLIGILTLVAPGLALGGDFEYIDNDELAIEIEARDTDIQRTTARIDELGQELLATRGTIDEARVELAEIERQLATRAKLLYRLSRHGKALRYLLTAESATGFLKRMTTLRSLVIAGLEEQRRVGFALTEAEARASTLQEELRQAEALRVRLDDARRELADEQQRRRAMAGSARR